MSATGDMLFAGLGQSLSLERDAGARASGGAGCLDFASRAEGRAGLSNEGGRSIATWAESLIWGSGGGACAGAARTAGRTDAREASG
jgi:hypothetical protein